MPDTTRFTPAGTWHFRALGLEDAPAFLGLITAGYAATRALGVHFAAASADLHSVREHLEANAAYVLEVDGRAASTVSIRYPWGNNPGPYGLPHLGWFATHPAYARQGLGTRLLNWLEQEILIEQLHTPAVSLGTAREHPWLVETYQRLGFFETGEANLGKGHLTVYMQKILNPQRYPLWKKRNAL